MVDHPDDSELALSIVIPAFNEEHRLPATLFLIEEYMAKRGERYEIVVADDGSSDNTVAVATKLGTIVVALPENRGKGAALRAGVARSRGRRVLVCDADLATPIEELETLKEHADRYDLVFASRALADSQIEHRQPWYREILGKTFNKIIQTLGVRGFKDTQCGFKLLDGDVARTLFAQLKINGFAYDVEMTWLALRLGYSIKEVGVRWQHVEESRVHLFVDPLKMFIDVCRFRFYHRGSTAAVGGLRQVDESEADQLGRASRL